jgi:hypothetical protein
MFPRRHCIQIAMCAHDDIAYPKSPCVPTTTLHTNRHACPRRHCIPKIAVCAHDDIAYPKSPCVPTTTLHRNRRVCPQRHCVQIAVWAHNDIAYKSPCVPTTTLHTKSPGRPPAFSAPRVRVRVKTRVRRSHRPATALSAGRPSNAPLRSGRMDNRGNKDVAKYLVVRRERRRNRKKYPPWRWASRTPQRTARTSASS